MKARKLSQNTKLEFVHADFVHLSQKLHPRGSFNQYIKIDKEEARHLVRHLINWVLVEEDQGRV